MKQTFNIYSDDYQNLINKFNKHFTNLDLSQDDALEPFRTLGFSFQDNDPLCYGENINKEKTYPLETILFIQALIRRLNANIAHKDGITTITGSLIAVDFYAKLTNQQALYSVDLWEYISQLKHVDVIGKINHLNNVIHTGGGDAQMESFILTLSSITNLINAKFRINS